MADATIGIRIDPTGAVTGARTVRRELDSMTGRTRTATTAINMLRAAMASLGAAISVRQLTQWADAFTQISNQLRVAAGSAEMATRAYDDLRKMSRETRTSLESNAQLYVRLSIAARELGVGHRDLIRFTRGVGQALAVTGTSGAQASGALLQLGQALGSAVVRAEEFNSILEGAPRIAQAVAEGLDAAGGSVSRLRNLILEGNVTNQEFFAAFMSQLPALQQEFERTSSTIGQALTVLNNELINTAGELDGLSGASESVARVLRWTAENLDFFVAVAGGVAVTAVMALTASINAATIATRAWTAALALTPLGAIAIAVGAVSTALIYYRDRTIEVGDTSIRVGNILFAVWTTASQPIAALVRWVGELLTALGQLASFDFSGSWETFRQSGQAWVDAGNNIIEAWRNLSAEGEQAETMAEAVAKALASAGSTAGDAASKFDSVVTSLTRQNERLGLMVQATEQGEDAVEKLNIAFQVHDELLAAGVVPATMSLHEAMALTAEGADENARAIGVLVRENARYERQLEDTRSAQEKAKRAQQDAAREAKRLAEEQGREFNRIVDDTTRYASDLFADLFRETSGGWRDLWSNMIETMKAALARMAAEAALRPIVVSVLGAMGVAGAGAAAGVAGIGGAGGGGGILGSLLGMGQQAASLADGGLFSSGIFAEGGALAGVGSFMSKPLFMVPTGAIEAGTGAMAMAPGISLGGVLGAAGLGYLGGGLMAQLTGGNQMGGSIGGAGGAALGATIGSAVPGIGTVLGGIVGGLLGGGIGSLFGGGDKDQEIRPISYAPSSGRGRQTPLRGIELDTTRYKGGGAFKDAVQQADEAIAQYLSDQMVQQVRDFLDERGTIRGEKRDNKEISEKHIRRALREMYSPVIEALGGPEAARAFSDMTSSAKPEKVLETAVEIAAFLGRLNDETLFKPQEISQLEAAWKALNERIDDAKAMAEQLGQSLEEVARQGEEARQAFHDEIQQGYQDQIDAMLRPAELAWRQLREAQAKEIEELEKVEASTAKARQWHQLQIRALFEQNYELQRMYLEGLIDLGEDLNAQIGALWGIVSTGIAGLIQGSNAAYQEAVRLGRQYAQINRNLQQTIAGLRTGPQSPLSLEQQLTEALDRFRQTLGDALGGDSEAAQQLQQLVNHVLDLASQFFGRTEGYAQIFDEVLRGLEMAGVAMDTQAGGFAALASALDAQIGILNEINDVLNQRDELGEDFESRYNKLTSELEDVGYTIGGINAFLQDAADAIPTTIVTAFASGLDSAQLAKRMGELFQATVTATEQAMRDGVEDIGAAINGAQQALLRGWIPDFIELAEQFNGTIPKIRFDRVTARVVAHYEASADQLGEGLTSAVAQVQFDGLERAIYTAQELVGTRFDAVVGGISFEGIDGTLLAMTLHDGITGIAQAAQVSLNGQAQRIEGVIDRTLEAFTLDATRATILDSVDIINNGATSVLLAFGRVEGALLRLTNSADGHIIALIDEVDTAIARFVNWGAGSLRVGVESLRTGLLDVRNAGEGALLLFADTVEARLQTIKDLDIGNIVTNINSLRSSLVSTRNTAQNRLANWANRVQKGLNRITNISNDLGGGSIAAELKKIVENRLPKRFREAIDRAFGNVFDTAKPTAFFKNMAKLVGANSELVTSLRELSRTMLLLARKDQIDAFAASIGARADKAMRVPSLGGARGKLNADQGWENQGHSYARINYSASSGFTMGATHKSGGSGSSQLNKMKTRAQELMDQLNHLVSVNRIAIDPSKLPSTLELNSRKGKASAQQIFDDLIKRGAVVARVDDPKDDMLKRMANEMRRLTGGTLPQYGADYRVKNGKLQMDLWAGDRSLTRTGSRLTDLNDIAGQFLQMLKHEIKVSSKIEPLLKAIDFRPAGLGPQGGLEQLARSLMEHGLGTGNVPKFASGGYHAGGLAIVGERGRELVDFASPARIYSASDTSRIMAGFANDNGSFRELIAEVRALRAENAELRRTVSEGFGDTVQAEGQSGLALRAELRGLREDVEDLQATMRQQERRRAS